MPISYKNQAGDVQTIEEGNLIQKDRLERNGYTVYTPPAAAPAPVLTPGIQLNSSTGNWQQQDPSQVMNPTDAKAFINSNQQSDYSTGDDVPVRNSVKTIETAMEEIKNNITAPEPVKPNFEQKLTDLRNQNNVGDLENSVAEYDKQKAALEAKLRQTKEALTNGQGSQVAENVLNGRVSAEEKLVMEEIDFINRQKDYANNQLQTKYKVIDSLMKASELDYNTAKEKYDTQFNQNLQLINAAKGITDDLKNDQEKAQDNARANAQIVINSMTARGITYDKLSPAEQTSLTKLGVESGLGADFFNSVMSVSSGKEILTTITSQDDTKATIIYKDGTSKTISTGLPARRTSDGGGTVTERREAALAASRTAIKGDIKAITGSDGFVDPNKMIQIRQQIAVDDPDNLSWFDNAYPPAKVLNSNYKENSKLIRLNKW